MLYDEKIGTTTYFTKEAVFQWFRSSDRRADYALADWCNHSGYVGNNTGSSLEFGNWLQSCDVGNDWYLVP